jgi:hypothetical protein
MVKISINKAQRKKTSKHASGNSDEEMHANNANDPTRQRLEEMRSTLASNHPDILCSAFEMAAHLSQLAVDCSKNGNLEIECSLGIGNADKTRISRTWRPHLPPLEAQMVLTALDRGKTKWTSLDSDWHVVYDTYVQMPGQTSQRTRLRSVDGNPEDSITKTLLARTDFTCAGDLKARFQAKLESSVESDSKCKVLLLPPQSVRISTRRNFEVESETLTGITYRYSVIKAWTGRTAQEAEMMMQDPHKQGENSVEVEVELSWPFSSPERLLYACLGILVKTQDLVDLLRGSRDMHKSSFSTADVVDKPVKTRAPRKSKIDPTVKKDFKRKREMN